jgi:hypothetical protein
LILKLLKKFAVILWMQLKRPLPLAKGEGRVRVSIVFPLSRNHGSREKYIAINNNLILLPPAQES